MIKIKCFINIFCRNAIFCFLFDQQNAQSREVSRLYKLKRCNGLFLLPLHHIAYLLKITFHKMTPVAFFFAASGVKIMS